MDQNQPTAEQKALMEHIDEQKLFLQILTKVEQEMKTFAEQKDADNTLEQELLSLETI